MREVILSKNGAMKVANGDLDLFKNDIEINFTPIPNENVVFKNTKTNEKFIGFLISNDNSKSAVVICRYYLNFNLKEYLKTKIENSFKRKSAMYPNNFRLIHGGADGLPGMVIDCYSDVAFIQMKDCFYDTHREEVRNLVNKLLNIEVLFLEDSEYRLKNSQPVFEQESLPEFISIKENEIEYKLSITNLQKNGYYFDHRDNRKLGAVLSSKLFKNKTEVRCLDLFSYIGSWGLNLAKAGFDNITFVDQGNFVDIIEENIKINNLNHSGQILREDVFKYLEKNINQNEKFEIICCDPPAFCKSQAKKKNALEGYKKLINKLFKISSNKAIVNFGSCTQYVSIEELMDLFNKEARKNNFDISLCAIGTQGFDHTNYGFSDKSNYIKFISYYLEKNDEQ